MSYKSQVSSLKSWLLFFIISLILSCTAKTGEKAPDFSTKDLMGNTIESSHLKGKTVVINLWATWCGPCIAEIPQLNQLQSRFTNDSNVVFLAMSDDPKEHIQAFLKTNSFQYIQIVETRSFLKQFSGTFSMSYPQHLIINPNQEITYQLAGTRPNIDQILEEKIKEIQSL